MSIFRALAAAGFLLIAACSGNIYLRDGVTDGDTFFLSTRAMAVDDPVTQSWVSYSLTRSTCQLKFGGKNPARDNSFDCELIAREHLLETWHEQRLGTDPVVDAAYFDELSRVAGAGFLPEYVAYYFDRDDWQAPSSLDHDGFRQWKKAHLRGHKPETRVTGSWGYSSRVMRD